MEAGVGGHRVRGGEVQNRDVEVPLDSVAMGRIWGSVLRAVGNNGKLLSKEVMRSYLQ